MTDPSRDLDFVGLPWKAGGRTREGLDCAGLAWLWLKSNYILKGDCPSPAPDLAKRLECGGSVPATAFPIDESTLQRGDTIFLRTKRDHRHVVVCLGNNKFLNIFASTRSRIENGLTLLRRVGFQPYAVLGPKDTEALAAALSDPHLGEPATWIAIIVAVLSLALSFALCPSLSGFNNRHGRYGPNALLTQTNPEIPLPDLLGSVVTAGNAIYQQLPDKNATVTPASQKWNQIVVLCSGPSELIDYQLGLQLKGLSWQDKSWHNGTNIDGIFVNPSQTKDTCIDGTIGGDSNVPSISLYQGLNDISVPVDIRASYDRDFPIYGLAGCSYLVLRAVDSTKFNSLNFTCRVKCRRVRTILNDGTGFAIGTNTAEPLAGADGTKVRFKLDASNGVDGADDIIAVSALTVNGTSYTEVDATHQSGNVFYVNKLKGYIEFLTAPAAAATILITYTYYELAWLQNPALHILYLLTQPGRGKGFDSSHINFPSFVAARDYFDASITWAGSNGTVTNPRFISNYAVDNRAPIQDHLKALLDASNSLLFFSAGQFYLKAKKGTETSLFSFNTANIVLGSSGNSTFEAELADRTAKINRVKLLYHSDQTLQSETEVIIDDEDNQAARAARVGNNGIVDDNLKYTAVTTPDQAERLADMVLREMVDSKWIYRWTTNIKGLPLQPGDIVDVTHPSLGTAAKNMRLENLEYDELDQLKLTASEYVPSAYV